MHVFSRLKLRTKALIAPVIFLIAGAGLTISAVQSCSFQMMEQRRDALRSLFAAVDATASLYAEKEASGRLTRKAAMLAARDAISHIHVGQGDDIVVAGADATILVHPDAKLVGRPTQDLPPDVGAALHAQSETTRQNGPAFSQRRAGRPDQPVFVPKLSYGGPLSHWGWTAVAGSCTDDIEAAVWSYGERFGALTLAAVAAAGLMGWLAMAEFDVALRRAVASIRSLADGDMKLTAIDQVRHDEVGTVAKALGTLQASLAAAATLRNEAAAAQKGVVNSLTEALSRLAEGDLTCAIEEQFTAEHECLRNKFNAAVDALRLAVSSIISHTTTIRCGASEISHAAEDLSRRSETRAAGLLHTTAALDQITAIVRRIAEGVVSVQDVVKTAQGEASQGKEIACKAVVAMAALGSTAVQVTAGISIMDSLASQISLLALNAGIEAARAGDSGRGFGVVASEVRTLAQRSATAAQEVKSIFSSGMSHAGQRMSLVQQSDEASGRILVQVAGIDEAVCEITASTRDQATALAEVNIAVQQMDGLMQQSAVMVEHLTAATRTVADDSAELESLTGWFKVEAA